jgi:uncharacterized protein YkwD
MVSRLSTLLALALLAGLATAADATAVGVSDNHAAPSRAQSSSAEDEAGHGLIAPTDRCPGQADADASTAAQREAMRCMVDFARRNAGLDALNDSSELDRSAEAKSGDVLHCDSFSHFACGRDFTFWMRKVGYIPSHCWRVAENLAWGSHSERSVRSLFTALIHSPEHRANILGGYSQLGVGLRVGNLDGRGGTHVWTQHFGTHC